MGLAATGCDVGNQLPMMYVQLTVNLCHRLHPVWSCESTVRTDDVSVSIMRFHDQQCVQHALSEQHGHGLVLPSEFMVTEA